MMVNLNGLILPLYTKASLRLRYLLRELLDVKWKIPYVHSRWNFEESSLSASIASLNLIPVVTSVRCLKVTV